MSPRESEERLDSSPDNIEKVLTSWKMFATLKFQKRIIFDTYMTTTADFAVVARCDLTYPGSAPFHP